ncbi:uncharacterized protein OCT59_012402 [Rhizophagus irregularis]|nr:hypothetical protein OCT59_012402 [Rhizophagus irregularis]
MIFILHDTKQHVDSSFFESGGIIVIITFTN